MSRSSPLLWANDGSTGVRSTWPRRPDLAGDLRPARERIAAALGERALRIEHVGSTSVPCLADKPTIDILLVVASSANEETYLPAMDAAGYELRSGIQTPRDG
jgi:GrpB-like predicted nucleotidyltransferase (UPF0157 family)